MKTTTRNSIRNSICDHCHKTFPIKIKTVRTPGGGEAWSFTCPHCNHSYTVCTITPQGVELRRQIESIKAQLRLAPHREDLATQKEQLQAALQAEITSTIEPANQKDTA